MSPSGAPAPRVGSFRTPLPPAGAKPRTLRNWDLEKGLDRLTAKIGTQKEYAAYRGVTKQNVTHWKKKGLIKFGAPGIVDFVATDRRLQEHGIGNADLTDLTDASLESMALDLTHSSSELWSKADAEKVKENYAARLKQLEYDREAGKVVEIDDVVVAVASEYAVVRNRLLGIGSKVAPTLATLQDAEQIKAIIDAEVIEALNELTVDVDGETDFDMVRQSIQGRFGPPADEVAPRTQ